MHRSALARQIEIPDEQLVQRAIVDSRHALHLVDAEATESVALQSHDRPAPASEPSPDVSTGMGFENMIRKIRRENPLLTREQEVALAKRISAGREAEGQLAGEGQSLPPEECQRLQTIVADGQQAMDKMVLSNVGLVVSIAYKYYIGHPSGKFYGKEDLFEEGLIGLKRSLETFNPDRGFKFSTYATTAIKQDILRALQDKGTTVRLPTHMDKIFRMLKSMQEVGKNNTAIQTELEVSEAELARLLEQQQLVHGLISLNRPVKPGEPDRTKLIDRVVDKKASAFFEDPSIEGSESEEQRLAAEALMTRIEPFCTPAQMNAFRNIANNYELSDSQSRLVYRFQKFLAHPAMRDVISLDVPQESESDEDDWRDEASCKATDETRELFVKPGSATPARTEAIRKICGDCTVRESCRLYLDKHQPDQGRWYMGYNGPSWTKAQKKKAEETKTQT